MENMKYKKGTLGWFREQANKDGFSNIRDWNEWRKKNGKLPNSAEIRRKSHDNIIARNPYASYEELNKLAIERGYIDLKNYVDKELGIPNDNISKDLEQYFGIHITEKYVSSIFKDSLRMPINNRGYDWICKKGYKIQHKASCLTYDDKGWQGFAYKILNNDITDYFILTGWNNRKDLVPIYILLIHSEEIVRDRPFWMRKMFYITNKPKYLLEFERYNLPDKLEKLKECCKFAKEI
jgi:hypothetical protein